MRIGIDIGGSHIGVGLINNRNDSKYRRKNYYNNNIKSKYI